MSISVYLLLSCTTMWTLHRLKFSFYKIVTKGKPWQGIKILKRARKEISMENYKLRSRRFSGSIWVEKRHWIYTKQEGISVECQAPACHIFKKFEHVREWGGGSLYSEVQVEQMWTCLGIPVWWGGRAKASVVTSEHLWPDPGGGHMGNPLSLDRQYI